MSSNITRKPQSDLEILDFEGILSTFHNVPENDIDLKSFGAYQKFYDDTWFAVGQGEPFTELDFMQPDVTHEHVQAVIEEIQKSALHRTPCQRVALREALFKDKGFQTSFEGQIGSMNRIIDLALRLWLALHIRDPKFAHATKAIQWNDSESLQGFVAKQFEPARPFAEIGEKKFDFVLPDSFTALKLCRYSGIKIQWTSSLNQHLVLNLDQEHRTLKIFRLKHYLYGLSKSKIEIIPNKVVQEYVKTMNLLFPSWDKETQRYFKKKGEHFVSESPVDYPGPLYLSDFHFWRDRPSTLYTEFCSPPPSMTQFFNDRRNVLQWYTFWFAVLIVALTIIFGVISSVTTILSTRYTYQALIVAREAALVTASCPPVTCVAGAGPTTS